MLGRSGAPRDDLVQGFRAVGVGVGTEQGRGRDGRGGDQGGGSSNREVAG